MIKQETPSGLWSMAGTSVPLQAVEVVGVVTGGQSSVVLRQRYRNEEAKPIEAIYTFPLSSGATLTRLALEVGGRRLEGEIRKREEAFRAYSEAVMDGHGAALLEQERDEVATVTVGNLLPGEEVMVEIEFIEPMEVEEGVLRWRLPTRVAPRYIPGRPGGDRTGYGQNDPTDRVPDADRISPPEGPVSYGLKIDLLFDLGRPVSIESPSHSMRVRAEDQGRMRVELAQRSVPLDRDVIVIARAEQGEQLCAVACHHEGGDEPGFFAMTVVPDLAGQGVAERPRSVALVLDTSGSMEGVSLQQAIEAARLCLRHLRQGDRFSLVAFSTSIKRFEKGALVAFDEASLVRADRWLRGLRADGGTELLAPMVEAVKTVGDGVVILLTDGQVGNEQEILQAVQGVRRGARIYGFGVGTNVCEGLLRDLARASGGAVELIYPGEAIDEKVVAQFARATAPRVSDLKVRFEGVEVSEVVPASLPPLIEGESWGLWGRFSGAGEGRAILEGVQNGAPLVIEIPLRFSGTASQPSISKVWARERIRELAALPAQGRHAEVRDERIAALALKYGLASSMTSFVIVEHRRGERLVPGLPEARVVQVHTLPGQAPPGHEWVTTGAFTGKSKRVLMDKTTGLPASSRPTGIQVWSGWGNAPTADRPSSGATRGGSAGGSVRAGRSGPIVARKRAASVAKSRPLPAMQSPSPQSEARRDVVALLGQQRASGLWGDRSGASQIEATTRALLTLLEAGVTTAHPVHGTLVRKAIEALLLEVASLGAAQAGLAELALAVAWLCASGRRTREAIEKGIRGLPGSTLGAALQDEVRLRSRVEASLRQGTSLQPL